ARATCERLQETFDVERRADDLEADVGSRAYDARVALRVHVRYEADFLAAACVLWPNACDEEAGVAYRRARLEPARGGAQVASHGGKAHVAVRSDSLCTEANSGSHHDLGSVQRIQARVDDRAGTDQPGGGRELVELRQHSVPERRVHVVADIAPVHFVIEDLHSRIPSFLMRARRAASSTGV